MAQSLKQVLEQAGLKGLGTFNHNLGTEGLYEAEMRVAAFQNGYYVALCNRVGTEDRLDFALLHPNSGCPVQALRRLHGHAMGRAR